MARKQRYTVKQVDEALAGCHGLQYLAAQRLKCTPQTIINYINRFPQLRETIEAKRGENLDTAEASLLAAVRKGDAWAVCFYLKTQGKSRGYIERSEQKHEHTGGADAGPIQVEAKHEHHIDLDYAAEILQILAEVGAFDTVPEENSASANGYATAG